jgi:hypothetical protein
MGLCTLFWIGWIQFSALGLGFQGNTTDCLIATSERAGSILISGMGDFCWIVNFSSTFFRWIVFSTPLCGPILCVYGTCDHIWYTAWNCHQFKILQFAIILKFNYKSK